VLNRLVARHGAPKFVFVDNGSEFTGRLMDMWAYHHQVRIDFSRPCKPTDNGYVETFNGSLRDECLNVHWFESISEAKAIVEAWRRDYNEVRPHSALMDLAPAEFVRQARVSRTIEGLVTTENQLSGLSRKAKRFNLACTWRIGPMGWHWKSTIIGTASTPAWTGATA